MRCPQFPQYFKRTVCLLVQVGTDQQNVRSVCDSCGDQTVGIGIRTQDVQATIPGQCVGEKLGVYSAIVRDQYADPVLAHTRGIHKFLQRHHSIRSPKLKPNATIGNQALLRTGGSPTGGGLVLFGGGSKKQRPQDNSRPNNKDATAKLRTLVAADCESSVLLIGMQAEGCKALR